MRTCSAPFRAGFTLIELMISAGLMTMILASSYLCLSAGVAGKKMVDQRSEGIQSARAALKLIAADLRAAIPMSGQKELIGMRVTLEGIDMDNIDFATRNYKPARAHEPDYCEVSYFLRRDPEAASYLLIRRRDPTPDPLPLEGGTEEEIARGVVGLRFEYYYGFGLPYDDWGDAEEKYKGMTIPPINSYGLPDSVRITIVFDPEAEKGPKATDGEKDNADGGLEAKTPMTFQTIARLELAPYFGLQTQSSSGGAEAAPPDAQQQAGPEGVEP